MVDDNAAPGQPGDLPVAAGHAPGPGGHRGLHKLSGTVI